MKPWIWLPDQRTAISSVSEEQQQQKQGNNNISLSLRCISFSEFNSSTIDSSAVASSRVMNVDFSSNSSNKSNPVKITKIIDMILLDDKNKSSCSLRPQPPGGTEVVSSILCRCSNGILILVDLFFVAISSNSLLLRASGTILEGICLPSTILQNDVVGSFAESGSNNSNNSSVQTGIVGKHSARVVALTTTTTKNQQQQQLHTFLLHFDTETNTWRNSPTCNIVKVPNEIWNNNSEIVRIDAVLDSKKIISSTSSSLSSTSFCCCEVIITRKVISNNNNNIEQIVMSAANLMLLNNNEEINPSSSSSVFCLEPSKWNVTLNSSRSLFPIAPINNSDNKKNNKIGQNNNNFLPFNKNISAICYESLIIQPSSSRSSSNSSSSNETTTINKPAVSFISTFELLPSCSSSSSSSSSVRSSNNDNNATRKSNCQISLFHPESIGLISTIPIPPKYRQNLKYFHLDTSNSTNSNEVQEQTLLFPIAILNDKNSNNNKNISTKLIIYEDFSISLLQFSLKASPSTTSSSNENTSASLLLSNCYVESAFFDNIPVSLMQQPDSSLSTRINNLNMFSCLEKTTTSKSKSLPKNFHFFTLLAEDSAAGNENLHCVATTATTNDETEPIQSVYAHLDSVSMNDLRQPMTSLNSSSSSHTINNENSLLEQSVSLFLSDKSTRSKFHFRCHSVSLVCSLVEERNLVEKKEVEKEENNKVSENKQKVSEFLFLSKLRLLNRNSSSSPESLNLGSLLQLEKVYLLFEKTSFVSSSDDNSQLAVPNLSVSIFAIHCSQNCPGRNGCCAVIFIVAAVLHPQMGGQLILLKRIEKISPSSSCNNIHLIFSKKSGKLMMIDDEQEEGKNIINLHFLCEILFDKENSEKTLQPFIVREENNNNNKSEQLYSFDNSNNNNEGVFVEDAAVIDDENESTVIKILLSDGKSVECRSKL